MNKHYKVAFFITPFLLILGYIASDYYLQETGEKRVIPLTLQGQCQLLKKQCLLQADELKIDIYQQQEQLVVNANHALDDVVIFLVEHKNGEETILPYRLTKAGNAFYWHVDFKVKNQNLAANSDNPYTLRIIANIQGHQYISEFNLSE